MIDDEVSGMKENILKVALGCVLLHSTGVANAALVTVDFDGFVPTTLFSGGVEDGVVVGNIVGPVAVNSAYLGPFSAPNSIHHHQLGLASFSLAFADGRDFTLTSFFAGSAFGGADPLTLSGFSNGVLVGTDTYSPNPPLSYLFFTPVNLSGVEMDELVFDMGPAEFGPTHVDNIALNSISVPDAGSTSALLGLAMFAIVPLRRKLGLH